MHHAYFDHSAPFLPAVAAWLAALRPGGGGPADRGTAAPRHAGAVADVPALGRVLIIVPARRVQRVLPAELLRSSAGGIIESPVIVSVSQVIDVLAPPDRPVAGDVERLMAWHEALAHAEEIRDAARALLVPGGGSTPEDGWGSGTPAARLGIARRLAAIDAELVRAEIPYQRAEQTVRESIGASEAARWRACARLADAAVAICAQRGLAEQWRDRAHRAQCIDVAEVRARFDRIVIIGGAEFPVIERRALRAVADIVTVAIHVPPCLVGAAEAGAAFDAFGEPVPEAWIDRSAGLDEHELIIAADAEAAIDVALRGIDALARSEPDLSTADVTIGITETALADPLARRGRGAGLAIRWAGGTPLTASAPAHLVRLLAAWMQRSSREEHRVLAALLRHPHAPRALRGHGVGLVEANDAAAALDAAWRDTIDPTLACAGESVQRLRDSVRRWLAPLGDHGARSVDAHMRGVLQVLADVYGGLPQVGGDHPLAPLCAAVEAIAALARDLAGGPIAAHRMTGGEALHVLLELAADESIPETERPEAVESMGWLELPFDPAPALLVIGLDEEAVPGVRHVDWLLPDRLRRDLGLPDERRALARDICRLAQARAGRRWFRAVHCRRDAQGEPRRPSRVLLTGLDDEALVARLERLSAEDAAHPAPIVPAGFDVTDVPVAAGSRRAGGAPDGFGIPVLTRDLLERGGEALSVTEFRLYLQCPYRWLLARRLRLESVEDTAVELDPAQFGTLVHAVLERFGRDADLVRCADEDTIRSAIGDLLDDEARRLLGGDPLVDVQLQVERARARLDAFASHQAAMVRDGWRIVHSELSLRDIPMAIDGEDPQPINMKVDRIDVHVATGRLRVLDYKTSRDPPDKAHRRPRAAAPRDRWTDLQLPLYRHLLPRSDAGAGLEASEAEIEVGYILLPEDIDAGGLRLATWSNDDQDEAIDLARTIVREIRTLDPTTLRPDPRLAARRDPFPLICRSGVPDLQDGADGDGAGSGDDGTGEAGA